MNKRVSITIPCFNEEQYIERCINSVLVNNYPQELINIYVCDGLSTDKTQEIVNDLSKKHKNIYLLINKHKTTPYALNLGLKAGDEDVKIILGAHAEVDKNFIKLNVKTLAENKDVGCCGGIIENVYDNKKAEAIGLAMSSVFGVGNAHFRTGTKKGYVDTVAFGAYKKEVFEKIGFFDEELTRNQDDEFNYRVIKNGFKILLNPDIKCKYFVRASYSKLYKQYFQYGYWKVFVNKKHKTISSVRQLIPATFVAYLYLGLCSLFIHQYVFALYLIGVFAYVALGLFFAAEKANKPIQVIMIYLAFFVLHFSYGNGYIKAIFNFLIFNKQPQKTATKNTR